MPSPNVNINELDGQIGSAPQTEGRLLCVVGCSSSGTANQPGSYSSATDLSTAFGQGRLPEASALSVSTYGRSVVAVKAAAAASDYGSYGTLYDVVSVGTGAWSLTAPDADSGPADDYELVLVVTLGGVLGTGPISFKYSLDNGNTFSAITSLGTALSYTIPNSGGIEVVFGTSAQTVVAGDGFSVACTAPNFDSTTLTAAIASLDSSHIDYEIIDIVGPLSSTTATAAETAIQALRTKQNRHSWIGHVRQQTLSGTPETDAAYISSISTAFSGFSVKDASLSAADGYVVSPITGRVNRRQLSWIYAPFTQVQSAQIDVADTNLGAIPFIQQDVNGNQLPGCYNETISPGMSDAGFVTPRTFPRKAGLFINLPLIKNDGTGDFRIFPHRRVIDVAEDAAYLFLVSVLNRPVKLRGDGTGRLADVARKQIQAAGQAVLDAALLAAPMCSSVTFTVLSTDDVLRTRTIHSTVKIVPLGYPETIICTVSYTAASIQQAA